MSFDGVVVYKHLYLHAAAWGWLVCRQSQPCRHPFIVLHVGLVCISRTIGRLVRCALGQNEGKLPPIKSKEVGNDWRGRIMA